ncbi:MAG: ATP-binding protein [Sideroxydans sp.]
MQRQLPQITRRLNVTLDKLKAPRQVDPDHVDAGTWWEGLLQRYHGRNIQFALDAPATDLRIPAELFDSVADNLIENALRKPGGRNGPQVRVSFSPEHGGTLTVCDDGAAIGKTVAARLFEAPVPSQSGLGIGLYQAAKHADRLGFRLSLAANEPGTVCFVLAGKSAV